MVFFGRLATLTAVIVLALITDVGAQVQSPIPIQRLSAPIEFDGLSYEPAWEEIQSFPMVGHEPVFGEQPSERTEVRVAYDDDYMYFALRAYDSDPDAIRANILYRDRFGSDDYFEVMLDTFNDNETALIFTTNPAGKRRDVEVSRDASGPISTWLNADFDTFWDSAVTITEEGWFAEIRVPFSSMRFQDVDGRVVMGMSLQRIIARKSERVTFPSIEPNVEWSYLKPSRKQKIVMDGVYSRNAVYIRPYGVGGLERTSRFSNLDARHYYERDRLGDAGIDLKYGLTNNLTLDLTVNTDFAQVEADDQQVNLTRFSLFFPEKRQFFQERAGIFEFRTGGASRLFHSRRIGLTEQGELVRILGGARIVGRSGPWDIGFLDMQTAAHDGRPGANFGVLRLRRQILNPYSHVGGVATSRVDMDGRYNLAYGADGSFRLWGEDYLSFHWAQTFDGYGDDPVGKSPLEGGRFSGLFEKRLRDRLGYRTGLTWSGPLYNPGIGFVQRFDFTQIQQDLSYSWRPSDHSALVWHTLLLGGEVYLRNDDRTIETGEVGPEWSFGERAGGSGSMEAKMMYEDIQVPFFLDEDVFVPPGDYIFYRAGGRYVMSRSYLFRTSVNAFAGSFFDGWRVSTSVTPGWNVSRHLELGGFYNFNLISFPNRNQQFAAHIGRLRATISFDTRISTHIFAQYNSAFDSFSTNARFRFNFSEGNDLWIVYNEHLQTDRYRQDIPVPLSYARALMVKYTYTFVL